MMRFFGLFAAIIGIILSGCQSASVQPSYSARFEPVSAAQDFPVSVPSRFESTLGWLIVPEDRSQSSSNEIRLPVAIIHARSDTGKSPVVYLAGGPGTSAMNTAAYPGAYPWLEERDFIVIGQRGTHFAEPALMCPEYREAVLEKSDRPASVRACKARLEADGIDLDSYNSLASAADLEDLRTVLGIESWTLYGTSYGTRLALIYARQFGDHLDSMVLDSPLPPNAIYDDESASNLEQTLRAVARDCAQDQACDEAFPDLEQRFFRTLDDVARAPIEQDGLDQPVTAPGLASIIPLEFESSVTRAPLIMDRVARLDADLLARVHGAPQVADFAWGMRFSVWCSEALPFSARYRAEGPGDVLGGYESAAIAPSICRAWDVSALDPSFIEPVVSSVPTLIIAGEFDPLTPPKWGLLAAETLSRSRVVTIRGGGHISTQQWGGDGCAMSLANQFIKDPDAFLSTESADDCLANRAGPDYQLPSE